MAPAPKKNPTNTKAASSADTVAPDRLVVMRPLVFNRAANAAPDPKLQKQREQAQASTQALAAAFSACNDDDSSGIDIAAIDRALKAGANINAAVNDLGQTPLHIAASEGDIALVTRLLRAGANTRVRDHEGMTPLIRSLREGSGAISGMLARAEEKPEAQTLQGRHAIHDAAKNGHIEALEALIARGVSPTIRDVDGDSPAMEALKGENSAAVIALAYAGGLQKDQLKQYKAAAAVGTAVFDHHDFDMEAFLKTAARATPPALKPQPATLPPRLGLREEELFRLIAARETGSIPDALKRRPDLEARNAAGDTPLVAAARNGVLDAIETLAAKSAVKATGAFGMTALHHAAGVTSGWQAKETIRTLLAQRANVNAQDARGQTPLMTAIYAGNEDNIQVLLAGGAKLDIADHLGLTAIDHAALTRDAGVIGLIDEASVERRAAAKAKASKAAFKAAATAPAKKTAAKKPLAKQSAGRRYR